MFLSTTWALVGDGSNLKSHAGKVKGFIEEAFGSTTVILPAGGAGYKVLALLDPSDEDIEKADMYIHPTLKGEEIDHSGVAGNNGGLLASVKVDHQALVAKLPAWDSADKH
uniref:Uncharacterized protein n=1 Tax=Oncorhynchus mykiss TaxID=8022 RepID=A0A8C7TAU1_ONCMY